MTPDSDGGSVKPRSCRSSRAVVPSRSPASGLRIWLSFVCQWVFTEFWRTLLIGGMLAFVLLAAVTTIVSSPHTSHNWSRTKVLPQVGEKTDGMAPPLVTERGGYYGAISERNEPLVPTPARCMPELRTVKLRNSDNLSLKYTPSCTRIERCGGCCVQEELRSCQPTEIEYLKFKVTVEKYVGGPRNYESHKEIVKVERHLKCACDCIVKESDCNALQEYKKHECKCVCTNHDENQKCLEDNPKLKFWDSSDCTCQCINVRECTTGYTYNKHTCSCEPEQRQRINGGYFGDSRGQPYRRQP